MCVICGHNLDEWWSKELILLSEKTHSQGQPSWPDRVLRSPVFLNSQQDMERAHNVIMSVSLIYMQLLVQPKATFIKVSGLNDFDWSGIL